MATVEVGADAGGMKQLPKSTIKLITSTQVITSVFSVVKELVENSLDATATSIDIKLENFGFDKMEIRDNGCGIKTSDTPYMAQPHYTSKIATTDDLNTLQTYGFRGEALGSLCAVANVSISTKTTSDAVSTTYMLSPEGKVMDRKPSHLGLGTTVTVTNLFKNLPVRRQFYSTAKKRKDEMKRVEDLITAFGIIAHDVRFSLRHNKDAIWQTNPVADVKSILIRVFGVNVMSHMERIKRKSLDPEVEVDLFVPKPEAPSQLVTRSTNDRCFIFTNKRPIVMKEAEKLLRKYICSALGVETARHPLVFLHIELASHHVDVNLEPNKTAVLLHDKEKVLEFLENILEEIYGSPTKVTKATNETKEETLNGETDKISCDNTTSLESHNEEVLSNTETEIVGKSSFAMAKEKSVEFVQNKELTVYLENNQQVKETLSCTKESSMNETVGTSDESPQANVVVNTFKEAANFDIDLSDVDLTMELMKEFESDDPFSLDVSTPKLDRTGFGPVHTSTQMASKSESGKSEQDESKDSDMKESKPSEICDSSTFQSLLNSDGNKTSETGSMLAKQWAEGTAIKVNIGTVQPVQLLAGGPVSDDTPSTSAPCPLRRLSSTDSKPGSGRSTPSSDSSSSKPSSKSRKDRLSISSNQSTLFDVSVRRPPSGYLYFSRVIRRKVLAENPGATFNEVASIIVTRWKELSDGERESYEELSTKDASWQKFQETKVNTSKSANESESSEKLQPVTKKRKLSREDTRQKSTLVVKPKETVTRPRREKAVKFSLARLQSTFSDGPSPSQSQRSKLLVLIGQLESQSAWVSCHDNHLKLFQPIRAQEEIIYRRLMANHKCLLETLEHPRRITSECLQPVLLQTLLMMKCTGPKPTDPYTHITDVRVVCNGFDIRYRNDPESGEKIVELVGKTSIAGLNLQALREILEIVNANQNATLRDCRPGIVKHFLQSEAVRMTRQLPTRMSREDVLGLTRDLQCHLAGGTKTCFHGRPILHTLYDLDDLPRSQESCLDATEYGTQGS